MRLLVSMLGLVFGCLIGWLCPCEVASLFGWFGWSGCGFERLLVVWFGLLVWLLSALVVDVVYKSC